VGMVLELFHNCARLYRKVQEEIKACLGELKVVHWENDRGVIDQGGRLCAARRTELHHQFITALSQLGAPKVRNYVLFSVDEE
jgi:hypothetical protein